MIMYELSIWHHPSESPIQVHHLWNGNIKFWVAQEKPALWAQILEANDASDYEVEHFVDAPALDESPAEAPAAEPAAAEETHGKDKGAGAEAANSPNEARSLLQGYDMAKR